MTTQILAEKTLKRALEYVNAALEAAGHATITRLPKGEAGNLERSPLALALAPTGATLGSDRVTFADAKTAGKVLKAWGALAGSEDKLTVEGDPKTLRLPRPVWHVRRAVDRGRAADLVRKPAGRKAAEEATAVTHPDPGGEATLTEAPAAPAKGKKSAKGKAAKGKSVKGKSAAKGKAKKAAPAAEAPAAAPADETPAQPDAPVEAAAPAE
jgi:hypothetical protein